MATYSHGKFKVSFHGLPKIQPSLIPTARQPYFKRWRFASRPRSYKLKHDWHVEVSNFDLGPGYSPKGNKIVVLKGTRIDGASIPCPWVFAALTFGVLRPMGVLFTASVVHDYAFRYGQLRILRNNMQDDIKIERHVADELFRYMIVAINKTPVSAWLAWVGVRLGYVFVRYNGKRFGGRPPFLLLLTLLLLVGAVIAGVILNFCGSDLKT